MTHIFTGYEATVAYLMERLPLFSRIGKAALKPNLDNTIALCAALNKPHHRFKSIHIAGTNGKGSTAHALAAILQKAGYKTGLYTSPHLADFRERIRIDGQFIDKDWVVNFVNLIQPTIENNNPSFFEITVVMAFQAFADANVDIAVIETGLGGRLDSTNVITPLLSIITNISYDHTDLLGTTLAQIAGEKAGIIKPNIPVIIGERHVETEPVFASKALACLSPITFTQDIWQVEADKEGREEVGHIHYIARKKGIDTHHNIATDLQGNYQQHNLKTILTAAEMLPDIGYNRVDSGVIVDALRQVNANGLAGQVAVAAYRAYHYSRCGAQCGRNRLCGGAMAGR